LALAPRPKSSDAPLFFGMVSHDSRGGRE
jgi:hypothetical protein